MNCKIHSRNLCFVIVLLGGISNGHTPHLILLTVIRHHTHTHTAGFTSFEEKSPGLLLEVGVPVGNQQYPTKMLICLHHPRG